MQIQNKITIIDETVYKLEPSEIRAAIIGYIVRTWDLPTDKGAVWSMQFYCNTADKPKATVTRVASEVSEGIPILPPDGKEKCLL